MKNGIKSRIRSRILTLKDMLYWVMLVVGIILVVVSDATRKDRKHMSDVITEQLAPLFSK